MLIGEKWEPLQFTELVSMSLELTPKYSWQKRRAKDAHSDRRRLLGYEYRRDSRAP